MRIDLHIGIEKTGTSSIQNWLVEQREALADQSALYPETLGHRLSANLVAACERREEPDDLRRVRGLFDLTAVDAYREQLRVDLSRELDQRRPERLVLSCEHFSARLLLDEEVSILREFLAEFSTDIRVLVYLRRQDDWFVSFYSTAVKSGRTRPYRLPDPGNERPILHYDQLLHRWSSAFGRDAMEVVRLEDARGAIVADFSQRLALPIAPPETEPRDNSPLPAGVLEFLRRFNEQVPVFDERGRPNPARGDVGKAFSSLKLTGEPFNGNGGEADFYRRFVPGNRAVAAQYFAGRADVPDTLFENPPVREAQPVSEPALAEMQAIVASLWSHQQGLLSEERLQRLLLELEVALLRGDEVLARRQYRALQERYPEDARVKALASRVGEAQD